MIPIKIKRLHPDAKIPVYSTVGAAGADLAAIIQDGFGYIRLEPFSRAVVQTGISVSIPAGYEIQVRPRSGMALKQGVTVLNTPGTIDSDYRGEIGVILINHTDEPVIIKAGDRIAQMVVAPVYQAKFTEVNDLDETARGTGGYGSTGVKS